MSKPNFFIVGAPKAGTTSIHSYLSEHPDIFMSTPKEVNFFSHDAILNQGLYYKDYIAQELTEYEQLFSSADSVKAIGEASVSYLFYPGVAEKIKDYSSDAKILIFLRNPLERGYSHFMMDSRLGLVGSNYEDIIEHRTRHKHADLYYQQYVELGLYYQQVKQYLDVFGKENVQIYLLEDLKSNLENVVKEIFHFLEVESQFLPDLNKKYNEFSHPKTEVMRWLYKKHFLRKMIKSLMPEHLTRRVKSSFTKDAKIPEMSQSMREKLLEIYVDDIKLLAPLIDRDLSLWCK